MQRVIPDDNTSSSVSQKEQPYHNVSKKPSNGTSPLGEMAILIACRQYENGLNRSQVCMITGYKRSSVNTYLQRLKSKNLVEENGDKFIATSSGRKVVGNNYQPLPQGKELQVYWKTHLPEGESRLFTLLAGQKGEWLTRKYLARGTGYAASSVNTYLQRLSTREIIEVRKDAARASDFLFE
jgi:DNA-binding MarR family transcriptional regulator